MDGEAGRMLVIGAIALLVAAAPRLVRRLPLTVPLVCLPIGVALGLASPADFGGELGRLHEFELVAEFALVLALMGAGLRLDRRMGLRSWASAWRLLGIGMPLAIAATAVVAHVVGYGWPAALMIGAVLAPTDPVLAGDLGAGPPGSGEEGEIRAALTAEAGMNDGLAMPFVLLALALMSGDAPDGDWLVEKFVLQMPLSFALGWAVGRVFGWLAFRTRVIELSPTNAGLVGAGAAFVTYAAADALGSYGFVSVFVSAVTVRGVCPDAEVHVRIDEFVGQIERLMAALLVTGFGAALGLGLLDALQWRDVAVAAALLFVIRPVTAWLALIGTPHPAISRGTTAFFGVRGIGTLYYLVYAFDHDAIGGPSRLWALVGFTVLASIVLHGSLAGPWMQRVDRLRERVLRSARS